MKVYIAKSSREIFERGKSGSVIANLERNEIAIPLWKESCFRNFYVCYIPKLGRVGSVSNIDKSITED